MAMNEEVSVFDSTGLNVVKNVKKPAVFDVEMDASLVRFAHDNMRLNARQPYAVSPLAGMKHSAVSWGTGRAMARVPRIRGSGTRRAGQGAFANFCVGGRLAQPTKVTRRWQRKTLLNVRRIVTAMSVAATANTAMVEARGHRVDKVKSLPIIVSDEVTQFKKTKEFYTLMKNLNLGDDLEKVKSSKTIRAGKGKLRNRRYKKRVGVLVIHDSQDLKATKNIEGVDLMDVNQLNLLDLAPGAQLGRLVVWTESAFLKLESIFGTFSECSKVKGGFSLPRSIVTHSDLDELFYTPEVQSIITPKSYFEIEKPKVSNDDLAERNDLVNLYQKFVTN